ncbi:DNA mismatch repair protein MutS [Aliishimia ponticola]|uniref:DNA mismatch repair protein MutS n=1 Tax=Aliishimia ponticola TaxID=2499833 RepID=A0A4S4N685_9RHOB|nr:Smr/MutS family protein [Aliishimia ponticola]THH34636.1 DNA mismatch repair protein MutS [Aliishimia ponticola]
MKGRKPRQDELELWRTVAKSVQPRARQMPDPAAHPTPKPQEPRKPVSHLTRLPEISGGRAPLKDDLAPSVSHGLRSQPVKMDRKTYLRMQRGKLKPDARIDLHGMTLDRAHSALTRFVLSSHSSGRRLLLVITGKGKHRDEGGPIPVRLGVLRHQVPEWLRMPPLSSAVLQITEAHLSHGGGGAYYVYLRKPR